MTKQGSAIWAQVPPLSTAVGNFAYRPPKKAWYRLRWVQVALVTAALLSVVATLAS